MDFLGRGADGVVVAAERQFDRQLAPELDDPARDRAVSLVGPFKSGSLQLLSKTAFSGP